MGSHNTTLLETLEISIHPNYPWLDEKLKKLNDEQLKQSSKLWRPETWERYLCTLETPLSESTLPPRSYNNECENLNSSIFADIAEEPNISIKNRAATLLSALTPRQKQILKMTFWYGRSEREIANRLNLSRATVNESKSRSLRKLRKLSTLPATSPIMRAQDKLPSEKGINE